VGSVTERCEAGEAAGGGDMCACLLSPSSSMGKTPFIECDESCFKCCGLEVSIGLKGPWEAGRPWLPLALSAASALKSRSNGDCSLRGGTATGAREGEAEGLGEAESELSSGGGVGGPARVLAGTERERNLGIGRAEGAGEAWKVGPA